MTFTSLCRATKYNDGHTQGLAVPVPKRLRKERGIGMSTRVGENSSGMQTCTKRSIGDTDRWDVRLNGKFSVGRRGVFMAPVRKP